MQSFDWPRRSCCATPGSSPIPARHKRPGRPWPQPARPLSQVADAGSATPAPRQARPAPPG
ncbi:MAG: hypothetical protein EOP39_08100 [Rubrivivax sp.]|nr:MAG: hypothetical protein EOP39_08100 [Rubrivivax sp.]